MNVTGEKMANTKHKKVKYKKHTNRSIHDHLNCKRQKGLSLTARFRKIESWILQEEV